MSTQLETRIEEYVNTIEEVLSRKITHHVHAFNSDKIRGSTIEDLKNIIRGLLNEHVANKKAHKLKYSEIGALSKSEIYSRFGGQQNATLIPISVIEDLTSIITPNWTAGWITVGSFNYIHNGSNYVYPGGQITLPAGNILYLVVKPINSDSLVGTVEIISDGKVQVDKIHFAKIDIVKKTIVTKRYVRVGANHLSLLPSGGGIPISSGVSHKLSNLDSGWK